MNVRGCSGNVFNVSNSNLAGKAMFPELSLSTSIEEDIVVSRSLAEITNCDSLSSNKKLSRIGSVLELLITPPSSCNFLRSFELDTMNFMKIIFLSKKTLVTYKYILILLFYKTNLSTTTSYISFLYKH